LKRTRTRFVALVAGLALLGVTAMAPAMSAAKPTITLSGSTSVAPLAALLIKKYIKVCHHCANFRLLQGGSDIGVSDVAHGRVDIGDSSRDPKASDPGGLVFNKIAGDAICIITHSSNHLANIDQSGVQAVFGGDVRDWSGVPGASINGTIDVIVRTAASGTQDAFQKIFMGSKSVFGGASEKASNGLVQQSVQQDNGAIGYVSLHFDEGTNPVAYNGVACNLENAKSGQYGGLRNFYMVTLGNPQGIVKKFITWVQRNAKAQSIVATDWVPLR
jgi:phosphate transport system substrate-binding protein